MDLSVLIVSYNTRAKTLACLASLRAELPTTRAEVLVLDNASVDGSVDALLALDGVQLEESSENLGFARGVNRLARHARGEYLLLLNPDTELRPGALDELLRFARRSPAPAIHGGRTLRPDGVGDPDFAWSRATLWSTFCLAFGLSALLRGNRWFDPEAIGRRLGEGEHEVDIVSGCFFLIPRTLWEELGGFDPGFFVYGEEADLCLRAAQRGIARRVTTRAAVLHHGGASEPSHAGKFTKLFAAKRRLQARHWSSSAARAGGALLALHSLLRAGAFGLAARIAPRRFEARAHCWREVWRRRGEWLAAGNEAPPPRDLDGTAALGEGAR